MTRSHGEHEDLLITTTDLTMIDRAKILHDSAGNSSRSKIFHFGLTGYQNWSEGAEAESSKTFQTR